MHTTFDFIILTLVFTTQQVHCAGFNSTHCRYGDSTLAYRSFSEDHWDDNETHLQSTFPIIEYPAACPVEYDAVCEREVIPHRRHRSRKAQKKLSIEKTTDSKTTTQGTAEAPTKKAKKKRRTRHSQPSTAYEHYDFVRVPQTHGENSEEGIMRASFDFESPYLLIDDENDKFLPLKGTEYNDTMKAQNVELSEKPNHEQANDIKLGRAQVL